MIEPQPIAMTAATMPKYSSEGTSGGFPVILVVLVQVIRAAGAFIAGVTGNQEPTTEIKATIRRRYAGIRERTPVRGSAPCRTRSAATRP